MNKSIEVKKVPNQSIAWMENKKMILLFLTGNYLFLHGKMLFIFSEQYDYFC
jgi:hypothetical protein